MLDSGETPISECYLRMSTDGSRFPRQKCVLRILSLEQLANPVERRNTFVEGDRLESYDADGRAVYREIDLSPG